MFLLGLFWIPTSSSYGKKSEVSRWFQEVQGDPRIQRFQRVSEMLQRGSEAKSHFRAFRVHFSGISGGYYRRFTAFNGVIEGFRRLIGVRESFQRYFRVPQ